MIALVEHEGADLAQQHALLAAACGVDDRLAVVAALAHPEAVHGRLQALGVVAGDLRLQALGLFLQDGGDRIVNGGGDDADAKRDHDGRRGELPGRHSGRARHHQFEPPRQAEKTGHRADQHAERQNPLADLRHAKQRNLRDQQRRDVRNVADAPHLLDVVEQDDQREDAEQHRDQRGEETHAEIAVQGADHCAGSATVPVRRTNHSADGVDGPGQDGRRFDDQPARNGVEACRHRAEDRDVLNQRRRSDI